VPFEGTGLSRQFLFTAAAPFPTLSTGNGQKTPIDASCAVHESNTKIWARCWRTRGRFRIYGGVRRISHIATAEKSQSRSHVSNGLAGLGGIRRGRAGQRQWLRRERRPVSAMVRLPACSYDGRLQGVARSGGLLARLSTCRHPDITPFVLCQDDRNEACVMVGKESEAIKRTCD
jgi:hypothetical protein